MFLRRGQGVSAMQSHGGISLNNDGFSAPNRKSPPCAPSQLPAPPPNDTSLSIDPPPSQCAVYLVQARGGVRGHQKIVVPAGRKNSFRPTDQDKSKHFPFPPAPCSACIRERQQSSVSLMSSKLSDRSAGGGQEKRLSDVGIGRGRIRRVA